MSLSANRSGAVIFDLDGVLVDSEPLHVQAWKILFAQHGIDATEEEYAHGIGMRDAEWIQYLFERRGQETDPRWWQEAKRQVFARILERHVRPFEGVPQLIETLHPEFHLAVASNSWRENIQTVLRAMGVEARFQALVGQEEVERHKPHPEAFLLAASRLGVPGPRCTVIEDSPLGIRAARAAGMPCIGVAKTLPAAQLHEADLVLASLADPEPVVRFARMVVRRADQQRGGKRGSG
ncbi:MAG: HAD family hydrolase [Candidatus Brocadiia bacterium]